MNYFERYINFILNNLDKDVQLFSEWYMLFIVPAIFYFMILFLKYIIVFMPVWYPLLFIKNLFTTHNQIIPNQIIPKQTTIEIKGDWIEKQNKE